MTHSEECYQWHHDCAIAEVKRLREANDDAYSRGIDAGWALAQQSKAVQERNSGYTEEYATNVAAHARREEREACAQICEEEFKDLWIVYRMGDPSKLEAKESEYVHGAMDQARLLLKAIRARGEK